MQKKNILLVALAMLMWAQSAVFAVNVDSQIEDELNKQAEQEMVKMPKI